MRCKAMCKRSLSEKKYLEGIADLVWYKAKMNEDRKQEHCIVSENDLSAMK